jgi:hypothetical protein
MSDGKKNSLSEDRLLRPAHLFFDLVVQQQVLGIVVNYQRIVQILNGQQDIPH